MPQTIDLNKKANIKQKTAADIIPSSGLPVVAEYTADSVIGQTTIPAVGSLPFTIDTNAPENCMVFVNGKRLRPGASNDFTFAAIDGSGFSSKITLTTSIPNVTNIMVTKLGIKKEAEFQVDSRIQGIYDQDLAGFQAFIDETSKLTAVNTTPVGQQFRSTITNRAQITDIANDARAGMGIDRISIQAISETPSEFGPNGERVFLAVNDSKGLIRFVGNGWTSLTSNANGNAALSQSQNDYVEIVFYGTGLNLVQRYDNTANDIRATVDGAAEGANFWTASGSALLVGRNYATNQVVNVTSGLSAGIHTVKIRQNASGQNWVVYGFEVIGGTTVKVNPGIAYASGKKLITAGTTVAHNAVVTGTRGGRVVTYVKADGTIGQSFTATNASQANLASADHTNEDLIRVLHWREFGAGRSDDFSSVASGVQSDRAFTLDDGTTTLVGRSVQQTTDANPGLYIGTNSTGFVLLTFVGTGLDVSWCGDATGTNSNANSFEVFIDGSSVGNWDTTAIANEVKTKKIVSGLPYGTHTVKIVRNVPSTWTLHVVQFKVYGPKKPTLPTGAVEIADYFVMANYVANTVQSALTVGTGVLRKTILREAVFVGSGWSTTGFDTTQLAVPLVRTTTNGDYVEFSFFGTGFDIRTAGASNGDSAAQLTLDGSTNFSGFTTAAYGTGQGFTAATGVWDQSGNDTPTSGLSVSGLTLGLHKLRVAKTSGTYLYVDSLDVITPIHAPVSRTYLELQNTLRIGSCAMSDSRLISPVKSESPLKNVAQAVGVVSGPSTTSTALVPVPDMSVTHSNKSGRIRINYTIQGYSNTVNQGAFLQVYVDGVAVGPSFSPVTYSGASGGVPSSSALFVDVTPGVHKVDLFWAATTGTWIAIGTNRILTVEEA